VAPLPRPVRTHRSLIPAGVVLTVTLGSLTTVWCASSALRRREDRHRAIDAESYFRHPDHSHLVRALTLFGQWWLLVGVTAVVVSYLAVRRRPRSAVVAGVAAATVLGCVLLGKLLLVRSNTNDRWGLTLSGFPSGHTADATVLAGLLVLLIPLRARPVPTLLAAAVLGAAVGWSRITIGAHTTAEVVGGWLLGMLVVVGATAQRVRG
jgi:membrane-associated phospholipid phosphatase